MSLLTLAGALLQPPTVDDRPRRYVMPTAQGMGDGSSWANAAAITALNTQVALAGAAGGDVWLRADTGTYPDAPYAITNGGTSGNQVMIRGVDGDGHPAYATFVGTRASPYVPGGASGNGSGLFVVNSGASHVGFAYLRFERCGYGCIRLRQAVSDILIEDIQAVNVRAVILNLAGSGETATVTGLTIRRVEARGYSKRVVQLRYDTHDVLIEDVYGDSEQQDGDSFAGCVIFDGTAHDAIVRRAEGEYHYESKGSGYWNADAFASERGNYNLLFEDCIARHNTDGGFDLKSRSTTLLRCISEDNKRNYRLWGECDVIDCTGTNPFKRGGSGGAYQIGAYTQSFIRVLGGTWSQTSTSPPFQVEGSGFVGIDIAAQAGVTKPSGVSISYRSGADAQFTVFNSLESSAPTISSGSTADLLEGTVGSFPFTISEPAILELQPGGDASEFSVYARRLSAKAQDFEDPLHADQKIHAFVKARDANNNRSAAMEFIATVLNRADDPITPTEAFAYSGSNGCWHEVRPGLVWADYAMTIPADFGDPVMGISDLSGKGNHARQSNIDRCAIFQTDGSGRYWLECDGFDDFYEVGDAGEFRFVQMTGISVFDRVDDDDARRYLFSYPRSATAGTSFNAVYALGCIDTQTIWGRTASNNGTAAGGGAPRTRPNVASLRSTDGVIRSNNTAYVDLPDQATLSYASSVATARARLLAHGDPTVGGCFLGRWYGGALFNAGRDDDTLFRCNRQLGQLAGIAL